MPAPLPPNEAARLAALRSQDILDTPPEAAFDRITRVAAAVLDVPIVLISLLDEQRQWFKSRVGLDVPETPREQAFCGYTILADEMMQVKAPPETRASPTTRWSPASLASASTPARH